MTTDPSKLVEAVHRAAIIHLPQQPASTSRPGIHYLELPEAQAEAPLSREWNTYRREVARLLAEGLEGQFVLIRKDEIVGTYETWSAAREAGLRLTLVEPFLVHSIRHEEPLLRVRGINLPCPG